MTIGESAASDRTTEQTKGRMAKTVGYFGAFVALGMAVAALGPTLPALAEHTRSQLSAVSLLFTARSLGYLIGALQGGRLLDRLPGHAVLAAGLGLMAAVLALVPVLPVLWLLIAALLILGLAEGTVEVGSNALLLWLYRDNAGPFINALHFFFGVGAFVAPVLVAQALLLTGNGLWAYWFLGLLMVPAIIWLLRFRSQARPTRERETARAQANRGLVALVAVFFMLYVGVESSFGGWIPSYATRLQLASASTAAYLASAFWGSLTVGRLLSTAITVRVRPAPLIWAGLVGSVASVAVLLAFSGSIAALWVGTIGLGMSLAPIVPTTLALVQRRMTITGQATGWFFMGLGFGAMTVPWLIGQFFERIGPQVLVWTLMADLTLAVGVFGVLVTSSSRRAEPALLEST